MYEKLFQQMVDDISSTRLSLWKMCLLVVCYIPQSHSLGICAACGAGLDFLPKGIIDYWWVFEPISVALILFGIGWNLLGDGLIDAMNPRSVEN